MGKAVISIEEKELHETNKVAWYIATWTLWFHSISFLGRIAMHHVLLSYKSKVIGPGAGGVGGAGKRSWVHAL